MAPHLPPISVLSLSVDPGTLALIIIGLAALVFAIAQAVHGPGVLRSEEDWLERVRALHLPRLCQLEENAHMARLGVWEADGQLPLS